MDYTAAADGSVTAASTAITFSFGAAVTSLSAADITLTNDTGTVTKGELSGSGQQWTLGITAQQAGDVKVRISRDGIEAGEKTVRVYTAPAPPGPALTKSIDLYLSEGITREEWTGKDTAAEGWVLSVEEQPAVYIAVYKEAAQTITVGGTDRALVSPEDALDGISAGEDFAVFLVKTGDLVFDGGTRTFTLNVSETGDALPRSVTVSLMVNRYETGAAVFKLVERDEDEVEYLERVGGAFEGLVDAFTWVETNAREDTEYTIRVEKDERDVPHLIVGLNKAENATLRFRGTKGDSKILYPVDLTLPGGRQIAVPTVDVSRFNPMGGHAAFIQIGGSLGYTFLPVTFILGSNITIQSGQMLNASDTYTYILDVQPKATLVLESGSEIRDHDNTITSNRLIFMHVRALSLSQTTKVSAKLLIKGGSIINCKIVDNMPLIDMALNQDWWEDGSFYLAPGNVFTLSGNSSSLIGITHWIESDTGRIVQDSFIDLTGYLASGLTLPAAE
jgi:hypothetical protein